MRRDTVEALAYHRHVRGLTSWDDVVTLLLTEARSTVADASAPAGELP